MIQTKEVNYKEILLKENEGHQKRIEFMKQYHEAIINENLEKIKNLKEDVVFSKSFVIDELNETEFIEVLRDLDFSVLTKEDEEKIIEKVDSLEKEMVKDALLILIDNFEIEKYSLNMVRLMKKYSSIILELRMENQKN